MHTTELSVYFDHAGVAVATQPDYVSNDLLGGLVFHPELLIHFPCRILLGRSGRRLVANERLRLEKRFKTGFTPFATIPGPLVAAEGRRKINVERARVQGNLTGTDASPYLPYPFHIPPLNVIFTRT